MKKWISLSLTALFCAQVHAQEEFSRQCDEWWFCARAEYLCWWLKQSPEPVPLVVDVPLVPLLLGATLGPAGTTLVLGGKNVDLNVRSGARFGAAGWFTRHIGIEGNYLLLPQASKSKSVSSSGQLGSEFLELPFLDATTDTESFAPISLPGSYAGAATLRIENDMQGAEANLLGRAYCNRPTELIVLAGFRWWNFNEDLTFKTSSPNIAPPLDIVLTEDAFRTRNNFYGGQIGFDAVFTWNWFSLEMIGKIALGSMVSSVRIKGELATNFFNDFGALQTFPAGYFALPTNEGKFSHHRFSIIPEGNVNLAFQMAQWVGLQIGYTFLYVTEVVWAGNTMDRRLNPSQAPAITITPSTTLVGVARPKPLLKTEHLWAQGLNVGLKFCY